MDPRKILIDAAAVAKNLHLRDFLTRVSQGISIKKAASLDETGCKFVNEQIQWYGTVAGPRTGGSTCGPYSEAELQAYASFLRCPNTVNSFVTAVNSIE